MNCFKHQNTPAIAVCRNCFKGVCAECAIPFDDGIACSERCLEKAKTTAQVVANTVLAQKGARVGRYIAPGIVSLIGILYLGWAVYCNELIGFSGAAGAIFLSAGIVLFMYNKKYFKPIKRNDS